jgi:hypothetical protein
MSAPLPTISEYEKLGVFYLGRDVATRAPFLYDSKHLTTHAVVIGMTGSGKTGLSIDLLEEAAIDGIPAIVVDPKGDLGNLLLTFPELRTEDFAPWAPQGSDAKAEADKWREGLAQWGEDGARIQRLRDAVDIALYTPGSRVGQPLSILGSLAAPSERDREDAELVAERVTQVATSLLGLVGIEAEPGKSREHVLVATILQKAWAAGEDVDLAGLVTRVQDPPFDKVGVLDIESFFPKKERFDLAIAYNALLAAPGFDAWTSGPPLDVASLLWTQQGKPRISVLSIAHLDDAQRMFFVSLLLGQMVSWMRAQPGTPSLRALFFMDEVVGYFPPVAMPPSKRPLLVLLKQARAFGLGVVLATQNPVDLDYKGLSNAGTWLIGRLQTERDKARVLDGLEGVGARQGFDRSEMDKVLSALDKRQFYVHDVHAEKPVVIESRWSLSYLRGPLTRDEIKRLSKSAPVNETRVMEAAPKADAKDAAKNDRPVIPPDVTEVFFPTTTPNPIYRPMLVGAARVHFEDAKTNLDFTREVMFVTPVVDGPVPVRWEDAKWAGGIDVRALAKDPAPGARFADVPPPLMDAKSYAKWQKELAAWLARTQGIARFKSTSTKPFTYSQAGEDERSFRARLSLTTREGRDDKTAAVREKYGTKIAALEDKIRRAQHAVQREQDEASQQRNQSAFDIGGGLLGAVLGRGTRGVISGASRAARSANRAAKQQKDVAREKENLDALLAKHQELQREANAALAKAAGSLDSATMPLETVVTKPKKSGIGVHLVALAWKAE